MSLERHKWISFLSASLATLWTQAGASAGTQQVDVRVSMDGELLTSKIDGRALEVDPGLHGAPPAPEASPTPPPREHARPIASRQVASEVAPPPSAASSRPTDLLPYIVGGAGLAAVGSSFLWQFVLEETQ